MHENDPFLTVARGSVTKVLLRRVLIVHTPDPVDPIPDRPAQDLDPDLVHTNAISEFRGQEVGLDHQCRTHHEKTILVNS